ncbi:unnamed protein product [Amoebophrya sp. A120]|nr:unnamed protein product [Amoebophrya sp. A120]|eukprot:GSA120T00024865001.1
MAVSGPGACSCGGPLLEVSTEDLAARLHNLRGVGGGRIATIIPARRRMVGGTAGTATGTRTTARGAVKIGPRAGETESYTLRAVCSQVVLMHVDQKASAATAEVSNSLQLLPLLQRETAGPLTGARPFLLPRRAPRFGSAGRFPVLLSSGRPARGATEGPRLLAAASVWRLPRALVGMEPSLGRPARTLMRSAVGCYSAATCAAGRSLRAMSHHGRQ